MFWLGGGHGGGTTPSPAADGQDLDGIFCGYDGDEKD